MYTSQGDLDHIKSRSNDLDLARRVIVVVGVGSYSKRHLFEYLRQMEACVVLVNDQLPPTWAAETVSHFIKASLFVPTSYRQDAQRVVDNLIEMELDPFSVVTLYEDLVPFRACLQELLNSHPCFSWRNRHGVVDMTEALRNKDKVDVYNTLKWVFDAVASNTILLTDDNVNSVKIDKPQILKLSTSSSAFGCRRIMRTEEIPEAYKAAKNLIENTPADTGVGTCFPVRVFLCELYEGSEHDVDLIMQNGKLLFYVFSDNTPVTECINEFIRSDMPFSEKGCTMPSALISHQRGLDLINLISLCLRGLNLTHGVFNVEFILTSSGIKIIDVNPRPGGYYINEWIHTLFGINTFSAEVILQSSAELTLMPSVPTRRIIGYNVFSPKQLAGMHSYSRCNSQHCKVDGKVKVFYVQDSCDIPDESDIYATVYRIEDARWDSLFVTDD